MNRRPLIAGNWKLHLAPPEATSLAQACHAQLGSVPGVDLVVFPTALSVPGVVAALAASPIGVGIQWSHSAPSGAFTGANSPVIARAVGCGWMLAGHSEVRRDLGETDERVHASVQAGLAAGLLPMICIGESLAQREADQVEEVLAHQLQIALGDLHADQVVTCTLAYEPIWAIGTGVTASPDQAQQAHAFIRAWLQERYPAFVAQQIRVLYGGSVKPSNARELLSQPDIDGALVGGASLDVDSFAGIVRAILD